VPAGSARVAREADERAQEAALRLEIERLEEDRKKRRALLEDQITRLRSEYESAEKELEGRIRLEKLKMETIFRKRKEMGTSRKAET
jgi:circadian clock protein KaiC